MKKRGFYDAEEKTLIAEYEALPLKPAVVEKWLYGNAARFFRLA